MKCVNALLEPQVKSIEKTPKVNPQNRKPETRLHDTRRDSTTFFFDKEWFLVNSYMSIC